RGEDAVVGEPALEADLVGGQQRCRQGIAAVVGEIVDVDGVVLGVVGVHIDAQRRPSGRGVGSLRGVALGGAGIDAVEGMVGGGVGEVGAQAELGAGPGPS